MNTSTPEGRALRLRVLEEKEMERAWKFFKKKFEETGDKKWVWLADKAGFDVDYNRNDYRD